MDRVVFQVAELMPHLQRFFGHSMQNDHEHWNSKIEKNSEILQ
jgi:hypothetical protein